MTNTIDFIDIDSLQDGFTWLVLTLIDPAKNAKRYYTIGYVETLFGMAVVRSHGRLGHFKKTLPPVYYDTLDEAWPYIRKLIEKRLKNGYAVASHTTDLDPVLRVTFSWPPTEREPLEQAELFEETHHE